MPAERQTIEAWAAEHGARHRRRMWLRLRAYACTRLADTLAWWAAFWPALKPFAFAFFAPLIPCAGLVWGLWRLAGGGVV